MAESIQELTTTEELKQNLQEQEEQNKIQPKIVVYCPICTFPPEFCQYGSKYDKCQVWLTENYPQYLKKAPQAQQAGEQKNKEEEKKQNEGEEESKEDQPKQKKKVQIKEDLQIAIQKQKRQGKKFLTKIYGLHKYENINLKDTVKKFGKKFACGSSYNTEDLTIELQGDICDKVKEFILQEFSFISEENCVIKFETKKKATKKK